jgi:hypothetical protein
MAKLNKAQKEGFACCKEEMESAVFMFDRKTGRSFMAEYTGALKNHARLVVSYCGTNDTFKKKVGFIECAAKLSTGEGVILPSQGDTLASVISDFDLKFFDNWVALETL